MGRHKLDRERIGVSLPRGMAAALTKAAAEKGWDRSRLIEELARQFLAASEKKKPGA